MPFLPMPSLPSVPQPNDLDPSDMDMDADLDLQVPADPVPPGTDPNQPQPATDPWVPMDQTHPFLNKIKKRPGYHMIQWSGCFKDKKKPGRKQVSTNGRDWVDYDRLLDADDFELYAHRRET